MGKRFPAIMKHTRAERGGVQAVNGSGQGPCYAATKLRRLSMGPAACLSPASAISRSGVTCDPVLAGVAAAGQCCLLQWLGRRAREVAAAAQAVVATTAGAKLKGPHAARAAAEAVAAVKQVAVASKPPATSIASAAR